MVFGFTDPGGARPTPNRPTREYKSVRPSVPSFQDPGLSAGQYGFGSSVNKKPSVAPKMSTYDAGKKAYADFLRSQTGQSGGVSSIPTQSRVQSYMKQDPYGAAPVRAKYFDNRFIPTERLKRRGMQDQLLDQFKAQYTKPVIGSSNLLQMTADDAPMSLADYRNQVAFDIGPTPREILGDASYAMGKIGSALAEKGTPMMNLAKSFIGGIGDFFMPQNLQTGFNDFMQSGQNFNTMLLGLPPYQRRVYDMEIMKPGMTREEAYRTAIGTPKMATGGIATI